MSTPTRARAPTLSLSNGVHVDLLHTEVCSPFSLLPAPQPLKCTFETYFKIVFPLPCRWTGGEQLTIELFLGFKHESQTFLSDYISIFFSSWGKSRTRNSVPSKLIGSLFAAFPLQTFSFIDSGRKLVFHSFQRNACNLAVDYANSN